MKKYFITGLAILLPLAVTVSVVVFLLNLLTEPFVGIVSSILNYYGIFAGKVWIFSSQQLQYYSAKFFIVILLIGLTILLGLVARWLFFYYLLQFAERILHRIPLIRTVYRTSQDVINTVFSTQSKSFKQVVLVPFPNSTTYSVGLITKDALPVVKEGQYVAVFVPTTPNPTSGFLIMVDKNSLTYLDMSIEEAFKYVISCGMISPTCSTITKEEAEKRLSTLDL